MNTNKNKIVKIALFIGIFFIIGLLLFSYGILSTSENLGKRIFTKSYFFTQAKTSPTNSGLLKGEEEDRINVLLLGIGGKTHEGGNLTDTIIVASYKPSERKISMMSLPRDLMVYIPDYSWRKINHAYYFAHKEDPNKAGEITTEFISDLLDIPIHYYVTINFKGFVEFVDTLGGIEVLVENTLDDYTYPIKGNENVFPISDRYEHLHIEKGKQIMNGQLALKYARSRHALGVEGSDYARSRRQQNILLAIKEKSLSFKTLINPAKIKGILDVVKDNLNTNFELWEIYRLVAFSRKFDKSNMITRVIDASQDGPLIENIYDGAFVLETKTGDFDELKYIAHHIFNPENKFNRKKKNNHLIEPLNGLPPSSTVTREGQATTLGQTKLASIEIRNGTFISGLASKHADNLRNLGFNIILIGNAQKQNYKNTIIYNLNENNNESNITEILRSKFSGNIKKQIPVTLSPSEADYLVILGADIFY